MQIIGVIFGLIALFGLVGVIYPTPLHHRLKLTRWMSLIVCIVGIMIAHPLLPKDKNQNNPEAAKPKPATLSVHTKQEVKQKDYTKLTIDSVAVQNNKVVVQGSTDLPDGAQVWVVFDIPQKENEPDLGSSDKVPVKSGHYQATITPRPLKELEHGPYVITVDFYANTNNQSPTVLKLVGEKGENIKGPLAKKDDLGTMDMETTKKVDLKLNIKPPAPGPVNGNFSPEHPVPASYLKQVLSFMDTFYHQLKDKENTATADGDWLVFLSSNNSKGWDFYHKINYQTNNNEDPNAFVARTDVAQAWVFLESLDMDITSKLQGDNNGSESEDEKQYLEYYNKAVKEVDNIQ